MPPDSRAAGASARLPKPHRVPIIDKTMSIIEAIEGSPDGVSVADITRRTRLSRTTVYRIVNTLHDHGLVRRGPEESLYRLGPRLHSLAAAATREFSREELAEIARPTMLALADGTRETCKLSVRDGAEAMVIDLVLSPTMMAPSSRVGSRFPLHAGAASKMLLACLPDDEIRALMPPRLEAFTPKTRTDPGQVWTEIEEIRRTSLSHDRGEWVDNVHAVAAPVLDARGACVAALSLMYFAGGDPDKEGRLAQALAAAAQELSRRLGHAPEVARR